MSLQHDTANNTTPSEFTVTAYHWNPYKNDHTTRHYVDAPRHYFAENAPISEKQKRMSNDWASVTENHSQHGLSQSASASASTSLPSTPEGQTFLDCELPTSVITRRTRKLSLCSAIAPLVPPAQVPVHVAAPSSIARDLLRVCLAQSCDARVASKVASLDTQSLKMLFALLLEEAPELIKNLFLKERGNVVVQLFSIPCAADFHHELDTLFQHVACLYQTLVTNKQGALALTRFYDVIPKMSEYRHSIDALTVQHFDTVVCNPFGNFLASQVIKNLSTASAPNRKSLIAIFCDPVRFVQISCERFGAHTAEVWVIHCGKQDLCLAVSRLVDLEGAVFHLADSLSGNNALQRILVRMNQPQHSKGEAGKLWKDCRETILAQAKGASFQRAVVSAATGRATRKR